MDDDGDDDSVMPLAVGDEEDEELDTGTVADDVNKEKSAADDGSNVNGRRTRDEDNSGTLYSRGTNKSPEHYIGIWGLKDKGETYRIDCRHGA